MKPLPKRRRTSSESSHEDLLSPPDVPTDDREPPLTLADPLSPQLALQSYYMPVLGGMHELFKVEHVPARTPLSLEFDDAMRSAVAVTASDNEVDDDAGDVEFPDPAHQPGNTKKRKVPANLSAAGHTGDHSDGSDPGEEELADRAIPTGRAEHEYDTVSNTTRYHSQGPGTIISGLNPDGGGGTMIDPRNSRARISRATLAGLSHKEMLKTRKRQLATVLGALSQGDTLALDQALSANYPFASSGIAADLQSRDLVRIRLSRRPVSRLSRAWRTFRASLPKDAQRSRFPESEFTFVVHSASEF